MAEHQYAQQPKKTDTIAQKQTATTQTTHKMQLPSSHPIAIIQRARINPKSLTHADVMQLQRTIGNRAVGRLLSEIGLIPSKPKQAQPVQMQTIPEEEKEPLQGKMIGTIQRQEPEEEEKLQMKPVVQRQEIPEEEEPLQGKIVETIQRQQISDEEEACPSCMQKQEIPEEEKPLQGKFESKPEKEICQSCFTPPIQQEKMNCTGMPDNLKAGVENLSGIDMSNVRVHYNSDKPAGVGALAYTQGTDVHVAPGQERHLPHEAWHVVQQAQERVNPMFQMKGITINDDVGLEKEATAMGARALTLGNGNANNQKSTTKPFIGYIRDHQSTEQTLQLKEIKVQAEGVTHLVKLNAMGSLYQENYIDNEVAETQSGDIILIETDNVLRSRRGANQELYPLRDQNREHNNKWVNAVKFNKRPLPAHSYIREGTYKETRVDKEEKEESLLLPYSIPANGPIYLIDASHRGDMYHLRAALAIENHPLIVYNFVEENDLTNYLSNAKDVNIYKLKYNPAEPREEDFLSGRVYRSVEVLSESDATKIIAKVPKSIKKISESMTTIPERYRAKIIERIYEIVEEVFGHVPANTALLMYRDSGQTGLVYPELDSGEALPQLGEMMKSKGFLPVLCGAPSGKFPEFFNIGDYWNQLDSIPRFAEVEIPGGNLNKFKRDIEAEFMRRAYEKKKFGIVVGFRSGALDLFTFLGIPTISISLKGLVGEDRHSKFVGNPLWKRTNIQYNIKRSKVTDLVEVRGGTFYMSPYWKIRGKSGEPSEKDKGIDPKPGAFDSTDMETVSRGLDIGIAKLEGAMPPQGSAIVNTAITRENVADIEEEIKKIKDENAVKLAKKKMEDKKKSDDAQKVISKLKSSTDKKIMVKNSEDDEETERLFGMSSHDFFQAYLYLRNKKLVHLDKSKDYLCLGPQI